MTVQTILLLGIPYVSALTLALYTLGALAMTFYGAYYTILSARRLLGLESGPLTDERLRPWMMTSFYALGAGVGSVVMLTLNWFY